MTVGQVGAAVAAWIVGGYVWDVLARPALVAQAARRAANGRPLLNVGAGLPHTSLRAALLGPTLWGDVNVDVAAPRDVSHGPGRVSFGDVQALPFPDRSFGAAIASHVLEHVADPAAALVELHRVADHVFVVTPPWWTFHAWAHPGHRWLVVGGTPWPLWSRPVALGRPTSLCGARTQARLPGWLGKRSRSVLGMPSRPC